MLVRLGRDSQAALVLKLPTQPAAVVLTKQGHRLDHPEHLGRG
jgi:hypothetical protein